MPTKRTPGATAAPVSDKATPGGVADRAREVLGLLGVSAREQAAIAERLDEHQGLPWRERCALACVRADLGPDGWTVEPGNWRRTACALALFALRSDAIPEEAEQALIEAAGFLHREALIRARRSAQGSKGGRPQAVSDEDVRREWERAVRDRRGKEHGALRLAASYLGLSEDQTSARLIALGLRKSRRI